MRTALAASTIALSILTLAAPSWSWAGDEKAAPAAASPTTITFSFKLDPRLSGATYGGERWISPPTYSGARAQDTVETMASPVDAGGMPVKANLDWTVSDPELLAVSPSRGERVTLTAKRAGESTVTVKAGTASKKLTVKADRPGGVWKVRISQ